MLFYRSQRQRRCNFVPPKPPWTEIDAAVDGTTRVTITRHQKMLRPRRPSRLQVIRGMMIKEDVANVVAVVAAVVAVAIATAPCRLLPLTVRP